MHGYSLSPFQNLTLLVMITDAFRTTIALSDWTLFSSSIVVSIFFRHPLGSEPVLLRASKHPALMMRKASIKGMGHLTRHRRSLTTHTFLSDVFSSTIEVVSV